MKVYTASHTREIALPMGGIGAGCISLAGNGRLVDWEIFNHPDKGRNNGYSHIAVKASKQGECVDARVLHGPIQERLTGNYHLSKRLKKMHAGFGFGPDSETLAGMPHFKENTFCGNYPFGKVQFFDARFPGNVSLVGFNPFIPGDDKNSSIPAAFFDIEIENTTADTLDYSIALSVNNPLAQGNTRNSHHHEDGVHRMDFSQNVYPDSDPRFGEMCIGTDAEDVSWQQCWYRGTWFDSLSIFWREFLQQERFCDRQYDEPSALHHDTSTLAAHITLAPGERKNVRFVIGWYFPRNYNFWQRWYDKQTEEVLRYEDYRGEETWRNYYATQFTGAGQVVGYAFQHWKELVKWSERFARQLEHSTLPEVVKEAISANLSTLKTPTCLRLEEGEFYGFEGGLDNIGSCEGSCLHVWNYAYALPYLFPQLERSMRDLNQRYNLRPDGSLAFRLMLPLGQSVFDFRACVDGQYGEVIKIYRDWKISGDNAWLREKWPAVKAMIAFAWDPENPDKWDLNRIGVISGRQHHTLDMELFGANSWLTGYWLAALKCGAEMAVLMGEPETQQQWNTLFIQGKRYCDSALFNGEYYCQTDNLRQRDVLDPYFIETEKTWNLDEGTLYDFYWNEEKQEINYQIGNGCAIDQVIAQWHANLCGLGEIFDKQQVKSALEAIWRYNFQSADERWNPCRLFAVNEEKGVVICEWPKGDKPWLGIPYAEENMCGFEYQVAAHMIQEGMIAQGVEIVRAIRDRYDGAKRNPWNEMECGSHYARSMASYSLLHAFSGFTCDLPRGQLAFRPVTRDGEQRYFWAVDGAWGSISWDEQGASLQVEYGKLSLQTLILECWSDLRLCEVRLNDTPVTAQQQEMTWYMRQRLTAEDTLTLHPLAK
ncbi:MULTISPECIES: GH116 family glycosyl-hydrolase [Enterobacterales]|uniref:GH116 family glycosyl-hydrolase n=1 Tax=Enterobacterales TaxID=91347 RepID=UPI002ED90A72